MRRGWFATAVDGIGFPVWEGRAGVVEAGNGSVWVIGRGTGIRSDLTRDAGRGGQRRGCGGLGD